MNINFIIGEQKILFTFKVFSFSFFSFLQSISYIFYNVHIMPTVYTGHIYLGYMFNNCYWDVNPCNEMFWKLLISQLCDGSLSWYVIVFRVFNHKALPILYSLICFSLILALALQPWKVFQVVISHSPYAFTMMANTKMHQCEFHHLFFIETGLWP